MTLWTIDHGVTTFETASAAREVQARRRDDDWPGQYAHDPQPVLPRVSVTYDHEAGQAVVQIDTSDAPGSVLVALNDGDIWDGDPETDHDPRDVKLRAIDEVLSSFEAGVVHAGDAGAVVEEVARIMATGRPLYTPSAEALTAVGAVGSDFVPCFHTGRHVPTQRHARSACPIDPKGE